MPDDDDEYEDYLCSLEEQDSEELLIWICEPGTTWDKSSQGHRQSIEHPCFLKRKCGITS